MAEVTPLPMEIYVQCFSGWKAGYVENHLEELPNILPGRNGKKSTKAYFKKGIVLDDHYKKHLLGDVGLGVCPINSSNHCMYAVIDIDDYSSSVRSYLFKIIERYALPFLLFQSKSGGVHMYAFFKEAESAKEVRNVLRRVVSSFALDKKFHDETGATKVEIFPKQDTLETDGVNGNCITLPYFNGEKSPNPMLAPDGEDVSFGLAMKNVWASRVSVKEIAEKLDALPYSDAPVCVQKGILSDMLEENSGRNDFLYSVSIFLKKKYGKEGVEEKLKEVNKSIPSPISDADISAMAKSVIKTERGYKCSCALCKLFCVKKECAKREYGLGRGKGHFTGVDFGSLTRVKSKVPYYIWELRVNDTDPFVPVVFKDSAELFSQTEFLKHCIDELSCAPYQVAFNDWLEIVNNALLHVVNQDISIESDSTDPAMMERLFVKFLVQKRVPVDKAYMIRFGSVIKTINGFYCFSGDSFVEYLNSRRMLPKDLLLRDTLYKFGCTEGEISYTTASGKSVSIPCWKKESNAQILQEESILGDVHEDDANAIDDAIKEAGADIKNSSDPIAGF